VHNFIQGKIANSVEHSRYTPYHFPHDTAVYGVANIRGGDNRFYNNIFYRLPSAAEPTGRSNFWNGATLMDGVPSNATFTQTPVGLSQYQEYPIGLSQKADDEPYDEFRKLPIFAGGNLYLGNAEPHPEESDAVVVPDLAALDITITDPANGKVTVAIHHPDTLNTGVGDVVTTAKLGSGYQAEMPYEQPDGSPYRLDQDFRAQHRSQVTPGPFAATTPETFTISALTPA